MTNDKLEYLLNELGCHHIQKHQDKYISCGMPDGDNTKSTIIYLEDYLPVTAYTRNIKDKYGNSDIISLVSFINKEENFSKSLKWICDTIGVNYYGNLDDDVPESIRWTKWMRRMSSENEGVEDEAIKPVDECILKYYIGLPHKILTDDGIDADIQELFEIGFDLTSHRITFPIRDEIGTLVGVKGRAIRSSQGDKYIYLEPCAKSHILYGLHQNFEDIKKADSVIVVESEKSVMKLCQNGYFNAVAIGGHSLSKVQVEKLIRLGVSEIILCYDEDAYRDKETRKIIKKDYKEEVRKFIKQQKVGLMIDENGLLKMKESPADDIEKFKKMYENRIVFN